jgi:hypothetical protein
LDRVGVPVWCTVTDDLRRLLRMVLHDSLRRCGVQKPGKLVEAFEKGEFDDFDWGEGSDEPVEAQCDLENPESCESCQ